MFLLIRWLRSGRGGLPAVLGVSQQPHHVVSQQATENHVRATQVVPVEPVDPLGINDDGQRFVLVA